MSLEVVQHNFILRNYWLGFRKYSCLYYVCVAISVGPNANNMLSINIMYLHAKVKPIMLFSTACSYCKIKAITCLYKLYEHMQLATVEVLFKSFLILPHICIVASMLIVSLISFPVKSYIQQRILLYNNLVIAQAISYCTAEEAEQGRQERQLPPKNCPACAVSQHLGLIKCIWLPFTPSIGICLSHPCIVRCYITIT